MAPPRRSRLRADGRAALLFLVPLLVIYLGFFGYGFWFLVRTSTTRVGMSFRDAVDVGVNNYRILLDNDTFRQALLNNVLFGAVSIVAALTVAFFVAFVISAGLRPKKLLYVLFIVPALMPLSLVATIFGSMLQQQFGVLNETLRSIGLGRFAQPWLTEPGLAFGWVAVIFCYLIGLPIMYYTADLSVFPTDTIEAALVDGAGTFQIMRAVIYPMMTATHVTVILSLLLGSFRALEVVLFSTGGGPAGSTEIVGTFLYQFSIDPGPRTGFVAAGAVVILLVAFVISIAQMFITRPRSKGSR